MRGRSSVLGAATAAALAHVVPDVGELAVRVVDVVLRLLERAEHLRGRVDERVRVALVRRELQPMIR